MDDDLLRLSGWDANPVESSQRPDCELRTIGQIARRSNIDLRDFVSRVVAGVFKAEGHISAIASGLDRQCRIVELRVGEPAAEWVLRLYILLIQPTISDKDAFGVGSACAPGPIRTLRVRGIVGDQS